MSQKKGGQFLIKLITKFESRNWGILLYTNVFFFDISPIMCHVANITFNESEGSSLCFYPNVSLFTFSIQAKHGELPLCSSPKRL